MTTTIAILATAMFQAGGAPKAPVPPPRIVLEPRSGTALLRIRSPLFPEDDLELVTCEAVLEATRDFGTYPVKLDAKEWKVEDGRFSWSWDFEQGFRLEFQAEPEMDSVLLKFTIRNEGREPLERVQIFPCLPTMGAPSFYPGTAEEARRSVGGRAARVGRDDYTQLYERLWLWSKGEPFAWSGTKLGRTRTRVGYTRRGEETFRWNWFEPGEETWDLPLLAVSSRDGKGVLAIGMERAIWACTNCGDGRACVHLLPWLGRIQPGKSASVSGRIYLMKGGPDDARKRLEKDFPKAARG